MTDTTTWYDIDVEDDLVEDMLRLGLVERVETFRATPLFDQWVKDYFEERFGTTVDMDPSLIERGLNMDLLYVDENGIAWPTAVMIAAIHTIGGVDDETHIRKGEWPTAYGILWMERTICAIQICVALREGIKE